MSGSAILGLGTAVFVPDYGVDARGLAADDPTCLLSNAFRRGITYVDTASGYGSSEDWLGSVRDVIEELDVRVCTKLPARELPAGIAESLLRLRCESVDTLLVHSAGHRELTDSSVGGAMAALKAAGQVRRCGASTYGVDDALVALTQPWCEVLQVEFSILNPSVMREVQGCRRPGQELVVRSVLAQGLLTGRRRDASHLDDRATEVVNALEKVANGWDLTLEQLAIRFALDAPGVDVVLVGIGSLAELDVALAAAANPPLSESRLAALREFDCSLEDWTHPERWTVRR